jgi:hypothetical protein
MIGRKAIVGLALLCSLAFCALAAQGAAAAGHGQTAFTCAKVIGGADHTDAHCDNTGPGEWGHVAFTGPTKITLTNEATAEKTTAAQPAHLFVSELHGVKEVEVNCTTVSGTGEAENSEAEGIMKASGSGTIEFTGCTANHSCTVTVKATPVKAELVEGLSPGEGMGLKFVPKTGTQFTTLTFTGSACPLKAFGAIPVEGSTIGTAHNEPQGEGATVYFGTMNSLTIGGQTPVFEGIATLRGPSGNALVSTTIP